jgi:hypothetical protein
MYDAAPSLDDASGCGREGEACGAGRSMSPTSSAGAALALLNALQAATHWRVSRPRRREATSNDRL